MGRKDENNRSSADGYYMFDISQLPDDLYRPEIPVSKWLDRTKQVGKEGFPANTLNILHDLETDVNIERMVGIALYMAWNVIPFVLPTLALTAWLVPAMRLVFYCCLAYVATLDIALRFFFTPHFIKKYKLQKTGSGSHFSSLLPDNNIEHCQYLFTERNSAKYLSTKYVWPASMHRPRMEGTPVIFCAIPHGVAPIGLAVYPLWSRLWNDRLCRWTAAPILFRLPMIGKFVAKIGYIPAAQKHIVDALEKKEQNVGIILDGIDGMFHGPNQEIASILQRKGIVKIALRAGVPLVPVYCFGHTSLWTVIVDPLGILKWLSNTLGASLTPFFGRYGWFLGPPRRIPLAVCLGEPVHCPRMAEPSKEDIEKYHQQLLESYRELFEQHKDAYGWGHKQLRFA